MQLKLLSSNSLNTFSSPKLCNSTYSLIYCLILTELAHFLLASGLLLISSFFWFSSFLSIRLPLLDWIVFITSYSFLRVPSCFLFSSTNGSWGKDLPLSVIRVALRVSLSQEFDFLWVAAQWGRGIMEKHQTWELIWMPAFLLILLFWSADS